MGKSPTKTRTTQTPHFFAIALAYTKLEAPELNAAPAIFASKPSATLSV